MVKQQIFKSETTGWIVFLGIISSMYYTGLHTEAIGRVQQLILTTGIIQPEVKSSSGGAPTTVQYDLPLVTLDGKEANLKDFKGKVIFLNLWATWCPPCVAEMPNIHNLYKKVASDDIVFVMLSLDEDPKKAQKFMQKKEYTFPVYLPTAAFPAAFETQAIPTTFIIAPDGSIVMRKEGMASYDTQEFRDFLQKLASQTK